VAGALSIDIRLSAFRPAAFAVNLRQQSKTSGRVDCRPTRGGKPKMNAARGSNSGSNLGPEPWRLKGFTWPRAHPVREPLATRQIKGLAQFGLTPCSFCVAKA